MNLTFPTLKPEDIEVKVKKITEKGAIALLYKTARVDMAVLDQVVGPLGWQCSYREVKGNMYCAISILNDDTGEWISKEDCGIESREDGEGNEKKGEASDSFKRAGFRWGIGRELYSSPFTFIPCATTKDAKGSFRMVNLFERYHVLSVEYDENKQMNYLVIVDSKGKVVFSFGKNAPKADKTETAATQSKPAAKPEFSEKVQYISAEQVQEIKDACVTPDGVKNDKNLITLNRFLKNYALTSLDHIPLKMYTSLIDQFDGIALPFDL